MITSFCLFFFFFCFWIHLISSVQSLSCVRLFATLWTTACQASLSITNSWSPPKPMSTESVMLSNHLILCCPLILLLPSIFPSIRVFSNELALCIRWPRFGVLASTSVLAMNTQDWSPLGWTGWISLQSKRLSRVFSKPQFKSINSFALSFLYSPTLTSIHVQNTVLGCNLKNDLCSFPRQTIQYHGNPSPCPNQ